MSPILESSSSANEFSTYHDDYAAFPDVPLEAPLFGKRPAEFATAMVGFLSAISVRTTTDGRIGDTMVKELCNLTGIRQAQIYLIGGKKPTVLYLHGQYPATTKPPKRPHFDCQGTPLIDCLRDCSQYMPDPQQLDLLLPVPIIIATPVIDGTSTIGMLIVEEDCESCSWDAPHCLQLFQFGQLFGQIIAAEQRQNVTAAAIAELQQRVDTLMEHQARLERTASYLDKEVDRQFFENQDLEKDREKLVNSFQKFVSPVLIDQIRHDPEALQPGGHKKNVTVFFADIRGFTSMSANMDPSETVALLNEYFDAMTEIILDFGGMLDKYVGDEIMALFGAPTELTDAAARAVCCALEMRVRLNILRQSWIRRGAPPFSVGYGLVEGSVTVGFIGSSKVLSYTAIGDSVNMASRLCSQAPPGDILISDQIARANYKLLTLDRLPPLAVKGKTEPLTVYRVNGIATLPEFVPEHALIRKLAVQPPN